MEYPRKKRVALILMSNENNWNAFSHDSLVLISGFMTRWGVHHYVVDPIGHCITPVPYHFDRETARLILEEVNYTNIQAFLEDFTAVKNHRVGSDESQNFAKNISDLWKDFGLDRVEINEIINKSKRIVQFHK